MIDQNALAEISKAERIGWAVVEKDYFLTLLLEGIANVPLLKKTFVFKGGTALRKTYFPDYRYSEDLDFTLKEKLEGNDIKAALDEAVDYLKKKHNATFRFKDFNSKSYFTDAKLQFVGVKGDNGKIALDLSTDEIIVESPEERAVFNPYYEAKIGIATYALEEMLAEKLRSLLQRTRVRDYYDVWYLLAKEKKLVDIPATKRIFFKKVEYKKLEFKSAKQLVDPEKLAQAEGYYKNQLSNQLRELPPFEKLKSELVEAVEAMF
jgi:uncharacterized protein